MRLSVWIIGAVLAGFSACTQYAVETTPLLDGSAGKPDAKDPDGIGDASVPFSCGDACDCPVEGATRVCNKNVGICTEGKQTCTQGRWGDCVGANPPAAVDCTSSKDNDCNGSPDNVQCSCIVGQDRVCNTGKKGICSAGKQSCVVSADKKTAAFGPCMDTVAPKAPACDGADNDCNGVVDTDQELVFGAADVGNICAHLLICPGTDRMEISYRNGIGYTIYGNGDATRRVIGYSPGYAPGGQPANYYRLVPTAAGNKFGPIITSSTCCPGGCAQIDYYIAGKGPYTSTPLPP